MQPDSAQNQVQNQFIIDSISQKSSRIRSGTPRIQPDSAQNQVWTAGINSRSGQNRHGTAASDFFPFLLGFFAFLSGFVGFQRTESSRDSQNQFQIDSVSRRTVQNQFRTPWMQPDSAQNQVRNQVRIYSISQKSSRIRSGIPRIQPDSAQNQVWTAGITSNLLQSARNCPGSAPGHPECSRVLLRIESGHLETV